MGNKNYESIKVLAEKLQEYKRLKEEEKKYSSSGATEFVLQEESEGNKKVYESIVEKIDEKKGQYSELKKEYSEFAQQCSEDIITSILKDIAKDKRKIVEDKLSFPDIGTISYKREKKLVLDCNEAERNNLISEIIQDGLYNLLDINEEKLLAFSEEMHKKNGHHVQGVHETDCVETKITLSRKKKD